MKNKWLKNPKILIPVAFLLGVLLPLLWCWSKHSTIVESSPCCPNVSMYEGIKMTCCGDAKTNDIETHFRQSLPDEFVNSQVHDFNSRDFIDFINRPDFNDYQTVFFEFGMDNSGNIKLLFTPAIKCDTDKEKSNSHFDENFVLISNYDTLVNNYTANFPKPTPIPRNFVLRSGYYIGKQKLIEILRSCISRYQTQNIRLTLGLSKPLNNNNDPGQLTFHIKGLNTDGTTCDAIAFIVDSGDPGTTDTFPRIRPSP